MPKNDSNQDRIETIGASAIAGGLVGAGAYCLASTSDWWGWAIIGVFIGVAIGFLWPYLRSFALRLNLDDWNLEEVDVQGLKFTSAGAQRRVAWRLFIEMTTRIATQPVQNDEGDDGLTLKSLYDLFQSTRKEIAEMQPTPNATGDTVETYALEMLNNDLRPFLSSWHPRWDNYKKSEMAKTHPWADHVKFRGELTALQHKIKNRARGLAQIAGIKDVERFFRNSGTDSR